MSSITSYRSYPNLVTSGAFQITLNATATTSVTLPTSGTLAVTGANNSFTSTQTVTVAPASNTSSDGIVLQDITEYLLSNPFQNTGAIIIGVQNTDGSLPTGAQTHTSARTLYYLDRGSDKIHSASARGLSQNAWLPLEELWCYAAANQELIIFPGKDQ